MDTMGSYLKKHDQARGSGYVSSRNLICEKLVYLMI